jgi:small conductance mechanosensitive channel
MNVDNIVRLLELNVVPVVLRLMGAVVIWYLGRWAIRLGITLITKTLTHNKLDATLVRYLTSIASGLLTVFLALGVLSFMGIETTSFAALAAGAGLAIGAAWSGMLSNFAAGVFMIVMRPFKVGDHIEAAGVKGTVREIGLFATWIDTEQKVQTLVGNGKIFDDKIYNFSGNPSRICTIEFGVRPGGPLRERMDFLKPSLQSIHGVAANSVRVQIKDIAFGALVIEAIAECADTEYEEIRHAMVEAIDHHFNDLFSKYQPGLVGRAGLESGRQANGPEHEKEEEGGEESE